MKRVLIVEDDPLLRELYTDTLKDAEFDVESATNGEEAYEKIKTGEHDLVLLDIILPGMDGIALMKKLQNEGIVDKPVIFLTNLDNAEEKKQALELGKGYVVKSSITPGDLVNQINKFLSS